MHGVLIGTVALACPVGMGLMMWFMARGSRRSSGARDEPAAPQNIEALRDEHRRLGEQIERLTDAEPAVPASADRVHS